MPQIHTLIERLAKLLEIAGVFIILAGVLLATLIFLRQGTKGGHWRTSYDSYRANLGRGILEPFRSSLALRHGTRFGRSHGSRRAPNLYVQMEGERG